MGRSGSSVRDRARRRVSRGWNLAHLCRGRPCRGGAVRSCGERALPAGAHAPVLPHLGPARDLRARARLAVDPSAPRGRPRLALRRLHRGVRAVVGVRLRTRLVRRAGRPELDHRTLRCLLVSPGRRRVLPAHQALRAVPRGIARRFRRGVARVAVARSHARHDARRTHPPALRGLPRLVRRRGDDLAAPDPDGVGSRDPRGRRVRRMVGARGRRRSNGVVAGPRRLAPRSRRRGDALRSRRADPRSCEGRSIPRQSHPGRVPRPSDDPRARDHPPAAAARLEPREPGADRRGAGRIDRRSAVPAAVPARLAVPSSRCAGSAPRHPASHGHGTDRVEHRRRDRRALSDRRPMPQCRRDRGSRAELCDRP